MADIVSYFFKHPENVSDFVQLDHLPILIRAVACLATGLRELPTSDD